MRRFGVSGLLLLAGSVAVGGCEPSLIPPPESGTVRLFHGERVVGHYVSPVAYEHYLKAQLSSLEGRSQEAADELRRALASDGTSPYLHTRLAEELMALGRLDEAREELDAALRLDPSFADAFVGVGRIQLRLGETAAAELSFRHAFEVDRTCEDAYLALAALYRERGDGTRADGVYRTLIDRLPGSALAHFNLAHSASARGDLAGWEAELRRALQLDGGLLEARLELGELLRDDGRASDAAVELRAAYERSGRDPKIVAPLVAALAAAGRADEGQALLDSLFDVPAPVERRLQVGWLFVQLHLPDRALKIADQLLREVDSPSVRLLRGGALDEAGRGEMAMAELSRIAPSAPDYPQALLRWARILRDAGRFGDAIQLLQKPAATVEKQPEADALLVLLADLQERLGNRALGQKLLEGAARARPDSSTVALALAGLYERGGDLARAIEVARGLLRRSPDDAAALHFVGRAWAEHGQNAKEAQRSLERAFGLRPASGEIADSLGALYLKLGRLDDALRLLERAERITPDRPELLAHLGEAYLKKNDRARALVAYRRALGQRPDENVRHAVEEQLLLLETGRMGSR